MEQTPKPDVLTSLLAGAAAGVVVDLTLFPLDTLKTRLQSKAGFLKTGGFRGVYKGIMPVIIGSAPTSALFFVTYNTLLNNLEVSFWSPVLAASIAEFAAASLRVPIEILKQRKQVSLLPTDSLAMVSKIVQTEGYRGMYRGFFSTLSREIPFGCIQYPLWEWIKVQINAKEPYKIGLSGAVAGGVAAFLTTPMDVIKTRVMLAESHLDSTKLSFVEFHRRVAREIYSEKGFRGFFSGVLPRVAWITAGGFIYFGVYGQVSSFGAL